MHSDLKIMEFLDMLGSASPAPGGGSAAALSGAFGASLLSMACNLTIGDEKFKIVEEELKSNLEQLSAIRLRLMELTEEDAQAFKEVMRAYKLPKTTEDEEKARREAIQESYKKAASVPLETAEKCASLLELGEEIMLKCNPSSITDVGVGMLMAHAGVQGAFLNVMVNLRAIKDTDFKIGIEKEIEDIMNRSEPSMGRSMGRIEKLVSRY